MGWQELRRVEYLSSNSILVPPGLFVEVSLGKILNPALPLVVKLALCVAAAVSGGGREAAKCYVEHSPFTHPVWG